MANNIQELATEIKLHESAANAALSRGSEGMGDYLREKSALQNAVDRYNTEWVHAQYEALMKQPSPMIAAIEKLTVDVLAVKIKSNKDTGIVESIAITQPKNGKDIDLTDFEDWAVTAGYPRVGVNAQWRWQVEKFNHVMCVRAGLDMSGEAAASLIRNNYKLSGEAKACTMADPTSNKEAVKLLQSIVDKIVFVDSGKKSKDGDVLNAIKVDERDLKYIKYLMCSRGAGLHIGLPKASTMRNLIMKAMNKNLTSRDYAFDFESEQKEQKKLPGFTAEETKEIVAEKDAA